MWTYRITAADRQTGREVRLELDAFSEAEAAQIVTRFALVRKIEQATRRDPSAATGTPKLSACPQCGLSLDASPIAPTGLPVGGSPIGSPTLSGPGTMVGVVSAGPKTAIGTVAGPVTFERTVAGRRISLHQVLGGMVALAGVPLLVFGLILSGRPEPEAARGDTMMLTAGILLAVGLGWLIGGSIWGNRGRE